MKRFSQRLCWLLLLGLIATTTSGMTAQDVQPSADGASEAQLVAVLQSDASHYEKVLACKRLARVGSSASVPVLASMLADEELSHPARIALEAIGDPAAGTALREAVDQLNGELLIGVLHSIGARCDSEAIEAMGGLLADSDSRVAVAAAWALGEIGIAEAADVALDHLKDAPPAVREALGDACLRCAEAQVDGRAAARIYHAVRQANLPAPIRLAATRGAILNDESIRDDLLREQLRAEDSAGFAMALNVSREIEGRGVTQLLVEEYSSLPPDRQALLLFALTDRHDTAALPTVTAAAASENLQIRLTAIRCLAELGDDETLPLLFEAAAESNDRVAGTALETLASTKAPGVDAAVTARLQESKDNPPQYLLELAGRRRIAAAAPILVQAGGSSDKSIRIAAIKALGETVPADEIDVLRDYLLATNDSDETVAVEQALRAACVRLADVAGEECARQLAAALPTASAEKKAFFLDLLRILGGKIALQAVSEAALSDDTQLQDTGTRILGEWMTPDAAPVLLTVSEKLGASKFGIRAMRGYIRIIRQFDVPDDERLAMCRMGLDFAQRDDERRLLLDALGRIPRVESLAVIEEYLDVGPLKEAACAAAVSVGEKIGDQHAETVARVMGKVVETTGNDEIARRGKELIP